MRSHTVLVLLVLMLVLVGSTSALHAADPGYFTVSGGWSWPASDKGKDSYDSGLTLAASIRAGLVPNYMSGFEVGYSWYSLNSDLAGTSGGTVSGGDMGMLSITTENDYIFGIPGNTMRPFLNLGLGYYHSYVDGATLTSGGSTTNISTGISSGSYFGLHGGIGALINKERFGVRLDANYETLFTGGQNLDFFSARAGIIFYIQTAESEESDDAE